ncbi:hypothetical protein ILP97_06030 [Amycolatopsis sp. H6(2020)]|nr:hypothetical protein [Amycolatopsis sp. H6(2020)]
MAMQAPAGQRLRSLGLSVAHYSLLFSVPTRPGLAGAGAMVSEIEQKITEQLRYADTAMLRALLDRVAVAAHEL